MPGKRATELLLIMRRRSSPQEGLVLIGAAALTNWGGQRNQGWLLGSESTL